MWMTPSRTALFAVSYGVIAISFRIRTCKKRSDRTDRYVTYVTRQRAGVRCKNAEVVAIRPVRSWTCLHDADII